MLCQCHAKKKPFAVQSHACRNLHHIFSSLARSEIKAEGPHEHFGPVVAAWCSSRRFPVLESVRLPLRGARTRKNTALLKVALLKVAAGLLLSTVRMSFLLHRCGYTLLLIYLMPL
jgi:hypothetical protein